MASKSNIKILWHLASKIQIQHVSNLQTNQSFYFIVQRLNSPVLFVLLLLYSLQKKSGQIIAVISLKKGLLILLQSAKMTLTKSEFLLWKEKRTKKQGKQRLCAHFLWKRKIITVPCRWSISLLRCWRMKWTKSPQLCLQ